MEDSIPVVVNDIVAFSLITAVVIILLVNTVLAIGALVRLGVINPELINVVVVLVSAVVTGVSIVVIAVCSNELIVEIFDGVVDVGSFRVEISGCVEKMFHVVDAVGFVHIEELGCVEMGLVSELLVEIFDVVVGVDSALVEVSGCVKTSN